MACEDLGSFGVFFSQLLLHFSEVMTKERHPRPLRLSGTFPNVEPKI